MINRELKRNANPKTGKYSFSVAQETAELRRERMKNPRKLTQNLKKKFISLIEEDWSPQQIKGRLNALERAFRLSQKCCKSLY